MDKKKDDKQPLVFNLPLADTKNPATDKQIEYLRSFENFRSKLSKHQLRRRLDRELTSKMITLLMEGNVVQLNNNTAT